MKYRTVRSRIIAAPLKNMLRFVFYSIFKLQFDQKKGPILLIAAVNSAARTVCRKNKKGVNKSQSSKIAVCNAL